jgi:hypothetical protein
MSIVSHENRFIFLKSRKTAGTSVSALLASICGPKDVIALSSDIVDSTNLTSRNIHKPLHRIGRIGAAAHYNYIKRRVWRIITTGRLPKQFELVPVFRQHMPVEEMREALGQRIWNRYYKFTIERNPYDRLVSFWRWRADWFGLDCSFNDFASSLLSGFGRFGAAEKGFSNRPFYLCNDGNFCVDRVLRFENLHKDLECLLMDLGVSDEAVIKRIIARMPAYKTSEERRGDYRSMYTPELKMKADTAFWLERELFGYKF